MCTVRLSYDANNPLARQKLEALLSTGLFIELVSHDGQEEFPGLDYSDPALWEDDADIPSLPKDRDSFTPEEVVELITEDIRKIYEADEVCV